MGAILTEQARTGAADSGSHKLARTLRERDLLYLFIGSVIGSGIFLTPGVILRQLGGSVAYSLLVWLVGGVLSLLGALTYAEFAAANPEAGGLYCFIRDAFGRLPAFLYGWSLLLVIASATIGALAHAFTSYLQEIVPLSRLGTLVVPVVMIAVVTLVNIWGTRKSSDLQNVTTLIKVGHHRGARQPSSYFRTLARQTRWRNSGGTGLAAQRLLAGIGVRLRHDYRAVGLRRMAVRHVQRGRGRESAEEFSSGVSYRLRAACRTLPICGSGLSRCAGAAAATASNTIAAAAATSVLGPWAGMLVAGTILISTFSSTNSVMLTAPRVFFAMANDIYFLKSWPKFTHALAHRLRLFYAWGVVQHLHAGWWIREVGRMAQF